MVAILGNVRNRFRRRHLSEQVYWELEVRDNKSGKILSRRRVEARSFLIAYSRLTRGWWMQNQGSEPNVIDVNNVGRSMPQNQNQYTVNTRFIGINDGVATGIQPGTGSAANTVSTFALQTPILNGSGAGQLVFGPETDVTPTIAGSVITWKTIRVFTNNTVSTITVSELALYARSQSNDQSLYIFCIARDVITPVPVPAGSTLTARYVHSITVS